MTKSKRYHVQIADARKAGSWSGPVSFQEALIIRKKARTMGYHETVIQSCDGEGCVLCTPS